MDLVEGALAVITRGGTTALLLWQLPAELADLAVTLLVGLLGGGVVGVIVKAYFDHQTKVVEVQAEQPIKVDLARVEADKVEVLQMDAETRMREAVTRGIERVEESWRQMFERQEHDINRLRALIQECETDQEVNRRRIAHLERAVITLGGSLEP
jgi:predicted metalloprotease